MNPDRRGRPDAPAADIVAGAKRGKSSSLGGSTASTRTPPLIAPTANVLHLTDKPFQRDLVINHRRSSAVAHEIAAGAVAVAAYVMAALCIGWLVSILLKPMGYDWPRFAAEAAISTGLGMIASWRLTNALFPNQSGKWIFAAFAGVIALVLLAGADSSVNWLHAGQALLLVGLAYGLFWPHRWRAR